MNNQLEILDNPAPGSNYEVRLGCTEFTCVCPRTRQPDFATVYINYTPDEKIVELKSLKLWLQTYRNVGIFHEAVLNQIYDKLWDELQPQTLAVRILFNTRGGIVAEVEKCSWLQ